MKVCVNITGSLYIEMALWPETADSNAKGKVNEVCRRKCFHRSSDSFVTQLDV